MDVIVVASQKGGCSKTTLTRSLAVAAQKMLGATAILDCDPQGSLTSWWNRREASEPVLVKLDPRDLSAGLQRLAEAGIERVFVDTPPSVHPELKLVLAHASLVVVPVKPSPDDLDAVGGTLGLIEEADKPFLFVLTMATPRTRLQVQAITALAQHGRMAPTVIHHRMDFPTAAISGLTVTELDPESASSREVTEVLQYVITQMRKDADKRGRKG